MAALVVGALGGIGDGPAWLAAILADRTRAPGRVIAAAALALAAAGALAAAAALARGKPPERLAGWRIGGFLTALAGLFILAFGDGVQFVVLALAAPAAAVARRGRWRGRGTGDRRGGAARRACLLALPLRRARPAVAALFLLAGAVPALQALALV